MKTTLLLPLLSGLLLVGCARTASEKTAASADLSADPSKSATIAPSSIAATTTPPSVDNTPPPTVSVTVPPPKTAAEAESAIASADGVATAPTDIVAPVIAREDTPASAGALTLASRIADWKLTAEDITEDIKKSDHIERTKDVSEAGAPTGVMETGTVANVIAAKFHADSEIAPLKLGVMLADTTATLTGTAHSPEQIGRAMALALDTDAVAKVVSRIKLESPASP